MGDVKTLDRSNPHNWRSILCLGNLSSFVVRCNVRICCLVVHADTANFPTVAASYDSETLLHEVIGRSSFHRLQKTSFHENVHGKPF